MLEEMEVHLPFFLFSSSLCVRALLVSRKVCRIRLGRVHPPFFSQISIARISPSFHFFFPPFFSPPYGIIRLVFPRYARCAGEGATPFPGKDETKRHNLPALVLFLPKRQAVCSPLSTCELDILPYATVEDFKAFFLSFFF